MSGFFVYMNYKRMLIEIESPEQLGYHLIKNNLTESSITDQKFSELNLNLNELVLAYGHHQGHLQLRELIATEYKVSADEVLITAGAASALFIVSSSLLEKGDTIIVQHPNYGTNFETPRAIGAHISYLNLSIEGDIRINIEEIKGLITPAVKFISITNPHNPTGFIFNDDEIIELIELAKSKNIFLLIDETYAELWFRPQPKLNFTEKNNHVIIVSSLSKAYGLPGIRLGWLICKNKKWMEKFLAAKEQMVICNSILDEEIAYQFLLNKNEWKQKNSIIINNKRQVVLDWLSHEKRLTVQEFLGGVVCFPKIRNTEEIDVQLFHKILNSDFGTYVGPGRWFEMEDAFFRIGYGWPSISELKDGLTAISESLSRASRK